MFFHLLTAKYFQQFPTHTHTDMQHAYALRAGVQCTMLSPSPPSQYYFILQNSGRHCTQGYNAHRPNESCACIEWPYGDHQSTANTYTVCTCVCLSMCIMSQLRIYLYIYYMKMQIPITTWLRPNKKHTPLYVAMVKDDAEIYSQYRGLGPRSAHRQGKWTAGKFDLITSDTVVKIYSEFVFNFVWSWCTKSRWRIGQWCIGEGIAW